ncbi:hypothetical protein [Nostoc sp.]|uniref:hypothetical protein n=1 Tax=Nostoc sp. TaxID=1180 RepID=UPI002FF5E402
MKSDRLSPPYSRAIAYHHYLNTLTVNLDRSKTFTPNIKLQVFFYDFVFLLFNQFFKILSIHIGCKNLSNHLLLVYADLAIVYEMQEAKALPEMNRVDTLRSKDTKIL